MNLRKVIVLSAFVMFGMAAWAEDYPKVEISGDYSLVHFVPAQVKNTHNLNGGGGSITYNFTKHIGIKGDFQGYGSQVQTFIIPVGNRFVPAGGTFTANGNLFTYVFGPQIKGRGKIQPYVQTLFGAAHSNVYNTLAKNIGGSALTLNPANNGFAMVLGGGVDIKLSKSILVRPAEVDYLLTRFGSAVFTTNNHNQNNFRYCGGIVFAF